MRLYLLLWSRNCQNFFFFFLRPNITVASARESGGTSWCRQFSHSSDRFLLPLGTCSQSTKIPRSVSLTLAHPASLLQLLCVWVRFVWYIICRLITFSLDILFTISYFSMFLLGTHGKYSTLLSLPFVCVFKMHSWIIALPESLLHPQEWLARLAAVSRVCLANPLIALCIQCCEP